MEQDELQHRAGKNLKLYIKANGYTQDHFAELIPVDPTTLRKWIKYGIDKLSILVRIAELFGIDVMDILK